MENSDLLTDANAWQECQEILEKRGHSGLRSFCEEVAHSNSCLVARALIPSQNFISYTSFRDISSLRTDFLTALIDIGFIPYGTKSSSTSINANSSNPNLLKAIILGGLYSRVAKVVLPKAMFNKIQAGTIQREHEAKQVKYYVQGDGRVFLHPGSVLFGNSLYKSRFLVYFAKSQTSKIFLRDATEVRIEFELRLITTHYPIILGALICAPAIRWTSSSESCRRWSLSRKRMAEAKGVAPDWSSRQSAQVTSLSHASFLYSLTSLLQAALGRSTSNRSGKRVTNVPLKRQSNY